MPIDYQQIYEKIQDIGKGARERKKTLEERRVKARDLLAAFASELDLLRSKVDSAKAVDANIRCAYPLDETLASSHPPPDSVTDATLIAADGSQINPDRHASVQFGLVNVGAITMRLNSGEAPVISTESELLFGDDLLPNGIPMSDGMVALKRDLAEREKLDALSKEIGDRWSRSPTVPSSCGAPRARTPASYEDFIKKYLTILSRLQSRGVTTAGYVDKPSADLVIRLLEIAMADQEQMGKLREFHPLRGVSDRWLYGERENPLLPPGHRSAVFRLQSSSEKRYMGVLSLHFLLPQRRHAGTSLAGAGGGPEVGGG
jgi:hypothetical protein